MNAYQVVEKESFGVDWHPVRYHEKSLTRFDSEEVAMKAATEYMTDVNCNNSLTKDEKLSATEVFMQTDDGIFLGILDGKRWYLTYPKDSKDPKIKTSDGKPLMHKKGEVVKDKSYYMLEGKTEVSVRPLPGGKVL